MEWMRKALALLLAMSMLTAGFVFAENTEEEHIHDQNLGIVKQEQNEDSEPDVEEVQVDENTPVNKSGEDDIEDKIPADDEEVVKDEIPTDGEEVVEDEPITDGEEEVEDEIPSDEEEVVEEEIITDGEEVVEDDIPSDVEDIIEDEIPIDDPEIIVEELAAVPMLMMMTAAAPVCDHADASEVGREPGVSGSYSYKNASYHTFTGDIVVTLHCENCGEITKTETGSLDFYHAYEDVYTMEDELTYVNYCDPEYHGIERKGLYESKCKTCGDVLEKNPYYTENDDEAHTFVDGRCQKCGYTTPDICKHETIVYAGVSRVTDRSYYQKDEYSHIVEGTSYVPLMCKDCFKDMGEERIEGVVHYEEEHYVEEGEICSDCGYGAVVENCTHGKLFTTEEKELYDATPDDEMSFEPVAEGHKYTFQHTNRTVCGLCGELVKVEDMGTSVEITQHWMNEDFICDCGMTVDPDTIKPACKHEGEIYFYNNYSECRWVQLDDEYHTFYGGVTRWPKCAECDDYIGEEVSFTEYLYGTEKLPHNMVGGTCTDCGYQCAHENTEAAEFFDDFDYKNIDADGHTIYGKLIYEEYCPDCEVTLVRKVLNENGSRDEDHWFEGGKCECGYVNTCEHKNVVEWEAFDEATFDTVTEKTHTVHGDIYIVKGCQTCGEDLSRTLLEENGSRTESHWFNNGKCECGYVNTCEHKETEEWEYFQNFTYGNINDETHTIYGNLYRDTSCVDCGETLKLELIQENTSDVVEHWYASEYREYGCVECGHVVKAENCKNHYYENGVDGLCLRCGTKYVAPTATPKPTAKPTMPVASDEPIATPTPVPTATPEPIATPEPVFEELPFTEVVSGVKAEDETKIAETVITIAETLEAEGEQVSMEIVNIEKVITTEEKAALDTLPVKEQLLTFLSVIGFEEQVNATLAATEDTLSDEAVQLKADILERVNTMDAEARAEFENALLESFPQEKVVIDGQEYTFFVLEIEVRRGDTIRIERYGFRQEGDEWILTKLEISK